MNNRITINAGANGGSLEIAIPNSAQAITATNNRAQYFASQAQKYRDEAKNLYDLTKYYAEQNSDVTVEYVTNIKRALELEIAKKQNAGNYLLTKDLPTKVSKFENDANYVNQSEMAEAVNILPEKTGNSGMFLKTDGINLSWAKTYHPPLLSYFWSEHKLNDVALLLGNTFSWQSGEAYSNAYNKLVEEYDNESSTTETNGVITYKLTPNGFKIADATQEQAILDLYNSTGSAKIYILDKENTRFKLPRWKHKTIKDSETIPVKGNGMTLGLTDGSANVGFTVYNAQANSYLFNANNYGKPIGSSSTATASFTDTKSIGITSDSSKSGIVAEINNIETDDMYLYFYVGEYTQSVIEQTAGLNAELLNAKADLTTPAIQAPYLKTSYINGTSGYNIWSNGYCEQWGIWASPAGTTALTFMKTFANTNYQVFCSIQATGMTGAYYSPGVENNVAKTTTGCTIGWRNSGTVYWRACGYLAEGEY